jgi:ATP/maltotriose-dependent transcriptional regulator MalT
MNVMCAQAQALLGDCDEAGRLLERAQAEADTRGERMWEPEIDRVRAGLLVRRGDLTSAEISLRRALAKARGQKACSLERRAALDLHDLLARNGRDDEARALIEGAGHAFGAASCQPEVARARAGLSPDARNTTPKGDRDVQ